MKCICTTHISMRYNGLRTPYFKSTRGLKQGDLLSPLLFVLCMEGLTALINQALMQGRWKHVHPRNSTFKLTRLAFEDDFILFLRATKNGLKEAKEIIQQFCTASGQKVNFSKSTALLSHSASAIHYNNLIEALRVKKMDNNMLYLGVPLPFGRKKNCVFDYLIHRMHKKTANWKEKVLLKAGKLVMIKAVLQSLPTYVMSCIKLPKAICKHLTKLVRNFWWSSVEKKIHWH